MTKLSFLTTLLVASLAFTLFAQDCSNPLLSIYGFAPLESPQSGADLPYCSNLINGETCCSADTVATFQDKANAFIDKLNNYAAAKDLYLAQLRNRYFDRFRDILEDINNDHNDDLRQVRDVNATLADELQNDIDSSRQIASDAREINKHFLRALDDYQKARNDCYTVALQVQASSWCLACDPNYATQGVAADGTVVFSDGLCEAISEACSPFFTQGASFNPLIQAREAYWRLVAISRYLNDVSDTDRVSNFTVEADPYNPLPSQEAVTVPDEFINSEEGGNGVQCQDLWAGDQLLKELLTIGESVPVVNDSEDTVVDDEGSTRLLQDLFAGDNGIWAPDYEGTGLDFNLRNDPGDFWGASDYSDYFNQTQNASDRTDGDGTDNDDHTDHDLFDRWN